MARRKPPKFPEPSTIEGVPALTPHRTNLHRPPMKFLPALLLPIAFAASLRAEDVRPIPPPGIEIPAADRAEIEAGVKKLGEEIAKLNELGKSNPLVASELPNVEIFHKSADWAVRYGEIFDAKQIATAKTHIAQEVEHAAAAACARLTAEGSICGFRGMPHPCQI